MNQNYWYDKYMSLLKEAGYTEMENKVLKEALYRILDSETDIGIYPKSFYNGDKCVYDKRNDFQEGWNSAQMKILEKIGKILKDLNISVLDDGVLVRKNGRRVYK